MRRFKKAVAFIIISCVLLLFSQPVNAASATPVDGKTYFVRNVGTGKYLTCVNTTNPNRNIVQQGFRYLESQRFTLDHITTYNNNKYYEMISNHTSDEYRIDVDNANDANGTNIKLFDDNPDYPNAQCFAFISNGDGTYRIMPRLSSTRVFEVVNGSTAENANVQLWTYNSSLSYHKWELVEATISLWGVDLVDSGKHLDWGGNTSLQSEVATAAAIWNGYKSGVIRKDTIFTLQDVEISDNNNILFAGVTNSNGTILLNKNYLDAAGYFTTINVITHELGHALGLGHVTDNNSIMYHTNSYNNTLSQHDKNSYDYAYSNY